MSAPTDLKGLKAQAGHEYLPKTVLIASYVSTTLSIGAVKTAHAVKTRRRKHKSKRKAKLFFSFEVCPRAFVQKMQSETESSTSTCLSNV